jgi:hypothetical protein
MQIEYRRITTAGNLSQSQIYHDRDADYFLVPNKIARQIWPKAEIEEGYCRVGDLFIRGDRQKWQLCLLTITQPDDTQPIEVAIALRPRY